MAIDQFIETNPICQKSVELLSPKSRKYSNRILRLYYDHLLAKNWANYSNTSYEIYCNNITEILKVYSNTFPNKPKRVANRIIRKGLITPIQTINGLNEFIINMIRYNSYNSIILDSIGDLVKNYESFNRDFELVFHELEMEFVLKGEKVFAE